MNRKHTRFLVFLLLSLGIVGLFAGREMASWRPQKLARFPSNKAAGIFELSASDHRVARVAFSGNSQGKTVVTLFDVISGTTQTSRFSSRDFTGMQNGFFWHGNNASSVLETVDDAGHKKKFLLKDFNQPENTSCLRIQPKKNRVFVLDLNGVSEWNFQNGKLQRQLHIDSLAEGDDHGALALSRDGQTLTRANKTSFFTKDTSTGKITNSATLRGARFYENLVLSSYGRYAFYDRSGAPFQWEVVDTTTGKALWSFSIPPRVSPLWAVSDDETTIVIPDNKEWEVRSLRTGATLRRLPLVPNATIAALSPDSATFYSVADGVLYRQRAR